MTAADTITEDEFDARGPSKSQRKRDMQSLRELGEKLLSLPVDHLEQIPEPAIVIAVQDRILGQGYVKLSIRFRYILETAMNHLDKVVKTLRQVHSPVGFILDIEQV